MTTKTARTCVLLLCAASILGSAGCRAWKKPVKTTWETMSTYAALSVAAGDEKNLSKYADSAKQTMTEMNGILSFHDKESELSKLNGQAGKKFMEVGDHLANVIRLSKQYAKTSEACFDPTIGPLMRIWGFYGGAVPDTLLDREVVFDALRATGFYRLVLSDHTAYLTRPGMEADLGGIAKGYAVDVAYQRLKDQGATDMMLNLGGNLRCDGMARSKRPWKVGVQNPFVKDEIIGTLELTGGAAVATSGNYERFITIGRKRYAHIIDPRTGYPVQGMAGVTVISKTAVEADALSTALFVAGPRAAAAILARLPDSQALLIPDETPIRIWVSPGFQPYFTPSDVYAKNVHVLKMPAEPTPPRDPSVLPMMGI